MDYTLTVAMVVEIREAFRSGRLAIREGTQDALIEMLNIEASHNGAINVQSLSENALSLVGRLHSCVRP